MDEEEDKQPKKKVRLGMPAHVHLRTTHAVAMHAQQPYPAHLLLLSKSTHTPQISSLVQSNCQRKIDLHMSLVIQQDMGDLWIEARESCGLPGVPFF